jgi:hypothetical protein
VRDTDIVEVLSHPASAGIVGALIGLKFAPGVSWSERLFNLTAGSTIAWFGAPAAIEFFAIKSQGMTSFLSFSIGMFGLSIAAAIFSGIKETKLGEILTRWLSPKG